MEDVLPEGAVLLDIDLVDKPRAISHVAGLLAALAGTAPETIEGALLAREALGSTGVGGGVALPHARLHSLRKTHAIFVRLVSPILYESIDSMPVDLLCAIVAPDEPNSDLLTAVSALARPLRDQLKKSVLRETRDVAQARKVLLSGEAP
ncbi:MAG TPA: PTS sugar transporter subunit IIA [Candidatus Binatia bacterium]|jgi:PTS system nitrogen regulatory IIA component